MSNSAVRLRRAVLLAGSLAGILVILLGVRRDAARALPPPSPFDIDALVGAQAPDFTLKDVSGMRVSLSSFKGSVVLLNFWATWCPPCRAEMPSMNKLGQRLKGRPFVILAVSTDTTAYPVKEFMKRIPLQFPVLLDQSMKVAKERYKISSLPTTFIIDKKGVVVDVFWGEQDWTEPDLVRQIEALL